MTRAKFRTVSNLLLILLVTARSVTVGQDAGDNIDPSDPGFQEKYREVEFGNEMAVRMLTSGTNDYYLVDMTAFGSRFERVWFLNLVFRDDVIVNIDPGIDNDRMWFSANRKHNMEKVLGRFDKFKDDTAAASLRMSAREKEHWMEKHDKYK